MTTYLRLASRVSFSDKEDIEDTVVDMDEQELRVFSLLVSEILPTQLDMNCWCGGYMSVRT